MDKNQEEYRECICPYCKKKFIINGKRLICRTQAERRGTVVSGPFCSRECTIKYFQEYKARPNYRYEKVLDQYLYEEINYENIEFLSRIINREGYISGNFL